MNMTTKTAGNEHDTLSTTFVHTFDRTTSDQSNDEQQE